MKTGSIEASWIYDHLECAGRAKRRRRFSPPCAVRPIPKRCRPSVATALHISATDGVGRTGKVLPRSIQRIRGYLLIECLVYIGVLFALLGVSYIALFRCINNSVALRRNAEDIAKALHIGEVWRADVRSATGNVRVEETNSVRVLYLPNARGQTIYCFATNTISRSYNGRPWSQLLTNVASSTMASDRRKTVTAWHWNLELQTRRNYSRVSPLFTFMSVPDMAAAK